MSPGSAEANRARGRNMKTLMSKSGWEIVEEEWPDFRGKIFKDRPHNVVEMLENTVSKYSDKIGFICGDWRLTYKEFDALVNRMAAGLEDHGVRKGDHVAVLLGIQVEFPLVFFALMKLGAVVVPLNTRFKGEELAYEINDSESMMLIVDEEYWSYIEHVRDRLKTVEKIFFNGANPPETTYPFSSLREHEQSVFTRAKLSESDHATIMYTSGTTGKPKGAVLHQRGFVLMAMLYADFVQFESEDKMICCVPLFHVTGLAMVMLASIFGGVACVYIKHFKTRDFLEVMAREKITAYTGVGNIIWLMINHPDFGTFDFSSFRIAMLGGSPATEEMLSAMNAKLPSCNVSAGYGLTESFGSVCTTPYKDRFRKIKACGKPLPLVEVAVMDDQGNELPPNSVGEIVLRGAKIFKGYWKNPGATKETIVNGWLHTGDIGKIDDEGFVYILDRKKDMINRGGEKIYSLEVENLIFNYPNVLEVAVVGVPDKAMGEAVKAVIALKAGEEATEDEIRRFCTEHLADYKVPKYVEFVNALPRNPAGKVIKAELRYIPGQ
jgi:acyl-CoA synthetase (AMP-forming)/AMP-acid ligase II